MSRSELEAFVERARWPGRRSVLDSAALEILDAFRAADVAALVLKGPALARLLYELGEIRNYADIDLLVGPDQLPRARRVLADLGYHGGEDFAVIDDVAGIANAETWLRETGSAKTGAIEIDLHWRLAGCDAPADIAWDALWARRSSIDIEGRPAPVLDRPGLALHLALHAAQHGPDDLKAIADLRRGVERWPIEVWRAATALADQVSGVSAFAAGLRLLPAGAELAEQLALPPTDQLTWSILHRASRPRGTFHLQAMGSSRGVRQRLNVLRRSLFPTRAWIRSEYEWAHTGGAKLAAAYAAHLIRAPLWAARSWRYRRRQRAAGS